MAQPYPGFINQLNAFLEIIQKDNRLTGNHVSLYVALFSLWNKNFFRNPFQIVRERVIRICHIGSFNTYSKCLRDLHAFGYINYSPSKKVGMLSVVSIVHLSVKPVTQNDTQPGIENEREGPIYAPSTVTDMRPIIRHIHSLDKGRGNALPPIGNQKPKDLEEVKFLFHQLGEPETEAAKFFHHYETNGWRQAGKIPISNWKAAAQKWLLNIHSSKTTYNDKRKQQPGNTDVNNDKDYSAPL